MKSKPQTAIKTELQTFTLGINHFLPPSMRNICFNYRGLDRSMEAVLVSHMVNAGIIDKPFEDTSVIEPPFNESRC